MNVNMRWKVKRDENAEFEECNGECRPLTRTEYAANQYMEGEKPVSYDRYRAYYGNPDRHVYLGVTMEVQCQFCSQWHEVGALWGIDFMDDQPEAAMEGRVFSSLDGIPGYLKDVAGELKAEFERTSKKVVDSPTAVQ